jgi:hypothetical protein
MAVTYVPPAKYTASYGGPSFRRTQSTDAEAERILDWNYSVTASTAASTSAYHDAAAPRRGSAPVQTLLRSQTYGKDDDDYYAWSRHRSPRRFGNGDNENDDDDDDDDYHDRDDVWSAVPCSMVRRRVTTMRTTSSPSSRDDAAAATGSRDSSDLFGSAVVGGLLGAAAGAALTLSMMSRERSPLQRRATLPDALLSDQGVRYVEMERTTEKVRFPSHGRTAFPSRYYPPRAGKVQRSREADDIQDYPASERAATRGRPPSSSGVAGGGGTLIIRRPRASSTAARPSREPLLITDRERSSVLSSRSSSRSRESKYSRSDSYSNHSTITPARTASTASASTVRPAQAQLISRSRARSRGTTTTTTTIKIPPLATTAVKQLPPATSYRRPIDRAASSTSARLVPLPPSTVGRSSSSRSSKWDGDDDLVSLAPSDSISCVGSRRSSRAHR